MKYNSKAQKSPEPITAAEWNQDIDMIEDVAGELLEVKATFDWRAFALGLLISSMLWWSMIAFVWRMI